MKKIKLYGLVIVALGLNLASCSEDFLTEEPASSISIDEYYKTYAQESEAAFLLLNSNTKRILSKRNNLQ